MCGPSLSSPTLKVGLDSVSKPAMPADRMALAAASMRAAVSGTSICDSTSPAKGGSSAICAFSGTGRRAGGRGRGAAAAGSCGRLRPGVSATVLIGPAPFQRKGMAVPRSTATAVTLFCGDPSISRSE